MRHNWLTNIPKSEANGYKKKLKSKTGEVYYISRPHNTDICSVEQLEISDLVGIYMEKPDSEMVPNPNCKECKGTGVITLFTSSSICKCVKKNDNTKSYYDDPSNIYLEP